jgi:hypothetical protein
MSDRTGAGKGAKITYRRGNDLDLDRVTELYRASSLGLRRPVDARETILRAGESPRGERHPGQETPI